MILLSAQTLAFGIAMALLVVPGTSLFLNAYGSEWLPVSYIAVAVVGTAISWMVARAVRRFQLVAVATVALGAQVLLFCVSWVVLEAGGRWISAVLLVSFPLALQIGFVFVGGQAGRVLNVRELKELFPRIVSGFVIGFFIGGLAGLPLLALREEPQDLLFGAAVAQLAFVGLLIVTDRRIPAVRSAGRPDRADTDEPHRPRVPLRTVLANRLIIVIFAYQVLSAMGSQLVDYLMFDRAAHRYPDAADLTRWVTWFTAVVNLVNIVVLVVFAGYLLKRFGHTFRSDRQPRCRRSLARCLGGRGGQFRHGDGCIPDAVRGHADHRHRAHRRHNTHVDQCDLSVDPGRRAPRCTDRDREWGSAGSHWSHRCDPPRAPGVARGDNGDSRRRDGRRDCMDGGRLDGQP